MANRSEKGWVFIEDPAPLTAEEFEKELDLVLEGEGIYYDILFARDGIEIQLDGDLSIEQAIAIGDLCKRLVEK